MRHNPKERVRKIINKTKFLLPCSFMPWNNFLLCLRFLESQTFVSGLEKLEFLQFLAIAPLCFTWEFFLKIFWTHSFAEIIIFQNYVGRTLEAIRRLGKAHLKKKVLGNMIHTKIKKINKFEISKKQLSYSLDQCNDKMVRKIRRRLKNVFLGNILGLFFFCFAWMTAL